MPAMIPTPDAKAQAPQIRPSRIVAAAVRVMVASGYEIELKPDGTLIARAVLTRLMEPTWGMQIAGRDAIEGVDGDSCDDFSLSTDDAKDIFRAMLRAAMEE